MNSLTAYVCGTFPLEAQRVQPRSWTRRGASVQCGGDLGAITGNCSMYKVLLKHRITINSRQLSLLQIMSSSTYKLKSILFVVQILQAQASEAGGGGMQGI